MPRVTRIPKGNQAASRLRKDVIDTLKTRRARFAAAMKAAREALYARPLSPVTWLLGFSRKDVRALPEKETYRLSVELLVFAKGTAMPARKEAVMIGETDLPSPEALARANLRAGSVFGSLRNTGAVEVQTTGWGARLQLDKGRLSGTVLLGGLSLVDAFTVRLYETLADLPVKHAWLHPCAICEKLFIAKRRDSHLCSSSCRTLQWRREHPLEFRKQRQRQYDKAHPVGAKWRRRKT